MGPLLITVLLCVLPVEGWALEERAHLPGGIRNSAYMSIPSGAEEASGNFRRNLSSNPILPRTESSQNPLAPLGK